MCLAMPPDARVVAGHVCSMLPDRLLGTDAELRGVAQTFAPGVWLAEESIATVARVQTSWGPSTKIGQNLGQNASEELTSIAAQTVR